MSGGWCGIEIESSFGPTVQNCRSGFDFTLFFEQLNLSIIPSVIFLGLSIFRVPTLLRSASKARAGWLLAAKILVAVSFIAMQIFGLVRWETSARFHIRTSTPMAILCMADGLAILILSALEHIRSYRPSTILQIYLLFTLLFDIVLCRTLWLSDVDLAMAQATTLGVALKLVQFCLEVIEKRPWLHSQYSHLKSESIGGIVNLSVFWWLNKLFLEGRKKVLALADLEGIDEAHCSDILERNLKADWANAYRAKPDALLRTMAWTLRWSLAASVLPRLWSIGFKFSQPFLVASLIEYLDSSTAHMNAGYGLVGAYALAYSGVAISTGFYWYKTYRTIAMVRGSLIAIIYTRVLELQLNSSQQSSPSALMSNDVERVCACLINFHELWASLIEVGIAVYILQRQIGVACISPALLAMGCGMGTLLLTSRIGKRQEAWLKAVQRRLRATESLLGSLKGTKMMGLTDTMAKTIQQMRLEELLIAMSYRKLQVTSIVISLVMNVAGPATTFTTFTIVSTIKGNGTLLAAPAFASITILALIGTPLITLFQALPLIRSAIGSVTRIQQFLDQPCHEDPRLEGRSARSSKHDWPIDNVQQVETNIPMVAVEARHPLAEEQGSSDDILTISEADIGWGHNCQIILRNINLTVRKDTLTMVIGPVGSGKSTLLKAILGETKIFKGSINTRYINIAFCDQSPWLLYDTIKGNITGVDCGPIDEVWYRTVIQACALDHDLEQLPNGDQTTVGSKGIKMSGGQRQRLSIARALYSREKFVIFDDVLSGLDTKTEEQVFSRVFGLTGLLRKHNVTGILATHRVHRLSSASQIVVIDETGTIVQQGDFRNLSSESGHVRDLLSKIGTSEVETVEEIENENKMIPRVIANPNTDRHDDIARKTGDFSLYGYYLGFTGLGTVYFALSALLVYSFCLAFPTIWLDKWSSANRRHPGDRLGLFLGIFIFLAFLGLLALLLFCWQTIVVMAPRAGRKLHSVVLKHALGAPLAHLTQIDTGVIMNRFSQDMQLIDFQITLSSMSAAEALSTTIMRLIIVCVTAKYIASILPLTLVVVYFIQKAYLQTSRQLRHLDLEAKAPIYTLFMETLEGLPTIRAFGWSGRFQRRNHVLLDAAQKPFYMLNCVQRWLQFVLDMLLTVVSVLVVIFAVKFKNQSSGGTTGVALVNVLTCHQHLAGFIQRWTLLETSIGAVARVRAFSIKCPVEDRPNTSEMPSTWHPKGEIEFLNISAGYSPNKPVLKDVTCSISAGAKIGVCGRTGSGKSTFILCLLQVVDLANGKIIINGVDLSHCSREFVRSLFITVPQDCVILEGNVRFNMDPHGLARDLDIENALRKVQLWDILDQEAGLDSPITKFNLSHGQRQLFSLARAMLGKGNVLVLDEAASSVDRGTNFLMQSLIRSEFADHTVICVEHHLENILDYDKIAVFDDGILVEFDRPEALMQTDSIFKQMM